MNGIIYVGGYNVSTRSYFFAIDRDGTKRWVYEYGNPYGCSSSISSSPSIGSDGTIYVRIDSDCNGKGYIIAFGYPSGKGAIFGKIQDANKKPVNGATVSINNLSATTDTNGKFAILTDAGHYSVNISKIGYIAANIDNLDVQSTKSTELNVNLLASVSGTVRDPFGNFLANVTVSTGGVSAQTDSDGYYSLGILAPGAYDIILSKTGYQTTTKTNVPVLAGQATTLDVSLPISLSGIVKDSSGNPLVNVTVIAGGVSTQTNSSGYYALGSLTPGTYNLIFSKSGYQTINKSNVTIVEEQATTLDVSLPISLSGTVKDASGNPLAEVSVTTQDSFFENFDSGNIQSPWVVGGNVAPFITSDHRLQFGYVYGVDSSSITLTKAISGNATVTFDYQVSMITGNDYLRFLIDGVEIQKWSGTTSGKYNGNVSAGNHTFVWKHTTAGGWQGYDTALLDNISIGRAITLTDGSYVLGGLSPGTYDVTFSKSGYFSVTVPAVQINAGEGIIKNVILYPPLQYSGLEKSFVEKNKALSLSLSVSGGSGNYTYSIISGQLPPGLTLNTPTGQITGTPTTTGTYEFTFRIDDGKGQIIEKLFHLEIHAQSWPMSGHDIRRSGQSEYNEKAFGVLKWQYSTSVQGSLSPVIATDGTVYFKGYDGSYYLYAMNPDGTLKWQYQTGFSIYSSPPTLASDGPVYVGVYDGSYYLHAVNPDGTLKWQYQTTDQVLGSPAIASDGTVYFGVEGYWNSPGYLHALNPDGTLKWQYQIDGSGYKGTGSPAIASDGTVYVGVGIEYSGGYLYAMNPDGTLKWRYGGTNGGTIRSIGSPAIGSDGTVYVGAEEGYGEYYLYAMNPDGTLKWRCQTEGTSAPAIGSDGTVYVGSYNNLYAINLNGTLKWRYQTGGRVGSPAIAFDGTIFAGSEDKYLYAVNSDGTLRWRYLTESSDVGSPAIASDGAVYFGSRNLYALHLGNKGVLKGGLKDMSTDQWLAVDISIGDGSTTQSSLGYYYLPLEPGTYQITFSKTGFQSLIVPNVVVQASTGIDFDILLSVAGPLGLTPRDALLPASVGRSYNERAWVAGGTGPYVFFLDSGLLPNGLQLDTQYGYITGIPTTPGSYTFYIGVRDQQNGLSGQEYTIDVTTPLVTTTASSLPRATKNQPYFQNIEVTGGEAPYTLTIVSGNLPTGLIMNAAGSIGGSDMFREEFNSSVLSSPWALGGDANPFVTADNRLQFGDISDNQTSSITLTKSTTGNATVMFDYQVSSESWDDYLRFLIDGVEIQGWSGTTSGKYTGNVSAGNHTFVWKYTKDSYSSVGSDTAWIDNISIGTSTNIPTATGDFTFSVKITDAASREDVKNFTLSVDDPVNISTPNLNTGITGQPYNLTLQATGGYGSYAWSVYSGTLPQGINLDASTGVLSGTPQTTATIPLVIMAEDSVGRQAFRNMTLIVTPPLAFITTTLPYGARNETYSEQIRVSGGLAPYQFTFTGTLPTGLSLNQTTGVISGTPTAAMLTNIQITVTDSSAPNPQTVAASVALQVRSALTINSSAVLPTARLDQAISPVVLRAVSGISPYQWSLTGGSLPPGLNIDAATGQLTGTPTTAGDYVFTITVTDSKQPAQTFTKEFIYHVSRTLTIDTNALPDGGKDVFYSYTLPVSGGRQPYAWRVKTGTLPAGLTIDAATGTIAGKPTAAASVQVTVAVTDGDTPAQTAEKTFAINISDKLFITTTNLPNGRLGQAYTANVNAALGTPPYSFTVTEGLLPKGFSMTMNAMNATISGAPTEAGTATFTVTVTDSGVPVQTITKQYTVNVYGLIAITTQTLPNALKGANYDQTIAVTGGLPPYTWSVSTGQLPAGLSLDSTTGKITGSPSSNPGVSSEFTIQVADAGTPALPVQKLFVIYVLDPMTITTVEIQGALQQSDYSATLAGFGGLSPFSWSVSQGALPEGMTMSGSSGIIGGKPAVCGEFDFTVRLTDAGTVPLVMDKAFHLSILCSNDYKLTGTIPATGIKVKLTGAAAKEVSTDANGNYVFEHLTGGTYTVTPIKPSFGFSPESKTLQIARDTTFNFAISKLWGDIDGDSRLTMSDAILCLKTLAGIPGQVVYSEGIRGGKMSLQDIIYIMQLLAGMR